MTEMSDIFLLSYGALWALVITLLIALFFLYRHHGQMLLNTREGRQSQGPAVGKPSPTILSFDVAGNGKRLLMFAGSDCTPCKKALPALSHFAETHLEEISVAVVLRGNSSLEADELSHLSPAVQIVRDPDGAIFTAWSVSVTPFVIAIDKAGLIGGKAMVTATEPGTSTFEAMFSDEAKLGSAFHRDMHSLHPQSIR